jgi:hypothetical protein
MAELRALTTHMVGVNRLTIVLHFLAMKAARNELKGLQAFAAARIPGLYMPHMVLVSMHEFQVVTLVD